jgi:hypothetical protein
MNSDRIQAASQAATESALHMIHELGISEADAIQLAARAAALSLEDGLDAGMGNPVMAPGFGLLAAGSLLGALGWIVYLLAA